MMFKLSTKKLILWKRIGIRYRFFQIPYA